MGDIDSNVQVDVDVEPEFEVFYYVCRWMDVYLIWVLICFMYFSYPIGIAG